MMFTNSVVGLILAAALGHAALLPRKEGHTALHTYKGKFDCDDSHWLENPECCQEHFLFELYDECEPVERKDKTVVDPCVVGRGKSGKKPACCDVPEEERFAKSKKRFEDCTKTEDVESQKDVLNLVCRLAQRYNTVWV